MRCSWMVVALLAGCGSANSVNGIWTGTLTGCDDADANGASVFLTIINDNATIVVPAVAEDYDFNSECSSPSTSVDRDAATLTGPYTMECAGDVFTFTAELEVTGDPQMHSASGSWTIGTPDGESIQCDLTLMQQLPE